MTLGFKKEKQKKEAGIERRIECKSSVESVLGEKSYVSGQKKKGSNVLPATASRDMRKNISYRQTGL
jgi:hypothetical protein